MTPDSAERDRITSSAHRATDPAGDGPDQDDSSAKTSSLKGRSLGIDNPDGNLPQADFSDAHLEWSNFDRADLTDADFRNAHLEVATFKRARLLRANFSRARLTKARLQAADLQCAILEQAELSEARLQGADLRRANLANARLSAAHLEGADLSGANLEAAWLRGAMLEDAYLEGADLRGAYLGEASLRGASLHAAVLRACKSPHAVLAYADLSGADLRDARLVSADLRTANLSDANLQGALLLKANLNNADLSRADLRGANLTDARLDSAKLAGATFDDKTILPDGTPWTPGTYDSLLAAPVLASDARTEPPTDGEFDTIELAVPVIPSASPHDEPIDRKCDATEYDLQLGGATVEAEDTRDMPARRVLPDLLNYLPSRLLPALTSVVTLPLYTHLFSPDEFGRYVLAFGLSELLMNAAVTGFAASAVRFFVVYKREGKLLAYFSLMLLSFSVMVITGTCVSAGLLLALRSSIPSAVYPLLWVAIPTFIAASLSEILMSILRAQERSRCFSLFEILNRVGTVIFSLVLIFAFNVGVAGLLWGQAITMLATSIPLLWITTRGVAFDSAAVQRAQFKQVWQFALPLTMGYVAVWWIRMSDRYIIEAFSNSYEVGLYSVSYNIAWRSIFLLIGLFLLVPGPIMMRAWEEKGQRAAEDTLQTLTRYFLLIIVPSVVGFAVLARPLVQLLTAEEYLEGYRSAWLVACAMAAQGLGELASQGAYIATRSRALARNQFLVAFVNFLLNLVLIPLWGFMGAALSMLLTFVLLAGLQARVSSKYLKWRWPMDTVIRVCVASAIMGLVAYLTAASVEQFAGSSQVQVQVVAVLTATLAGALVYGLLLVAMGEVSPLALYSLVRSSDGVSAVVPVPYRTSVRSDGPQ